MTNNSLVAVGAIGLVGAGAALTYFLLPMLKPSITISPNPATPGAMVTFKYKGFPANTYLVSMGVGTNGVGSGPMTIGQTDQNGNMTIVGAAPNLTSGTKILYVVTIADKPDIFATAIYQIT